MQFRGYDKERRLFSVELAREEAEDLHRVMQGIADHIDELDQAAMGVYSREEAMALVKDMDRVLEAFAPDKKSATVVMSKMLLLNVADAISGVYDTENDSMCLSFEISKKKMKDFVRDIWSGTDIAHLTDKKKLNSVIHNKM